MHAVDLIFTLTGGLAAALAAGYLSHRLGLSPIVGYLFAGVVVGPQTPGFTADRVLAEQLAEVGVILLMFGVGLQFHIEELWAVRKVAIPGAIAQSTVATLLGALLAVWLGRSWGAGLVFGIALSVASTVVLVRVLSDNRHLHTPTGHIAVGWLVVEDILTVLVLVLAPALFGRDAAGGLGAALALALALAKVGGLAVFTVVVGRRVIPWLLSRVAATRSRELFTLCVLVLALGIAVGSAVLFGVSMALGAFLAGIVVGRSDFSVRAASDALPMRDAFAVLFFVSVGMLFDPAQLVRQPLLVAATLAIVLVAKPLTALAITLAFGYPLRVGLSVAVALAQIGEFSFIVANLGGQLGVLGSEAVNVIVATSILSIALNPFLYRLVDPMTAWISRRPVRDTGPSEAGEETAMRHRAVVIGYGPVGRTVTRLLWQNEIAPTVIEMNMDTVKSLQADGVHAIYGDGGHRQTLIAAGVEHAQSVIISVAGLPNAAETIRLSKELNPKVQVLARTAYIREQEALRRAGADEVLSGEAEVALALAGSILGRLGATAEQIDRERARVHAALATGVA
jgi:CPA2 family monovalent cation:H+ antiporter-2